MQNQTAKSVDEQEILKIYNSLPAEGKALLWFKLEELIKECPRNND